MTSAVRPKIPPKPHRNEEDILRFIRKKIFKFKHVGKTGVKVPAKKR